MWSCTFSVFKIFLMPIIQTNIALRGRDIVVSKLGDLIIRVLHAMLYRYMFELMVYI